MIYTVTFNPAIDYIVHMGEIELGMVNRTKMKRYTLVEKVSMFQWFFQSLA